MSLETISEGIVELIRGVTATAGGVAFSVNKVEQESPEGTDEDKGDDFRQDADRVHFWRVYVAPAVGQEYAGGVEPRYSIRVIGHFGVSADAPSSGVQSDDAFRVIASEVLKTLQDPANRNPGGCILTDVPSCGPIVERKVRVAQKIVLCHTVEITYVAQEE